MQFDSEVYYEWFRNRIRVVLLVFAVGIIAVVLLQEGQQRNDGIITGGSSDTFLSKHQGRSIDAFLARWTRIISVGFFIFVIVINIIMFFTSPQANAEGDGTASEVSSSVSGTESAASAMDSVTSEETSAAESTVSAEESTVSAAESSAVESAVPAAGSTVSEQTSAAESTASPAGSDVSEGNSPSSEGSSASAAGSEPDPAASQE